MTRYPRSAVALALAVAILMALGLYFAFVRPPLLPEDLRFMGSTLAQVQEALPGLLIHRLGFQVANPILCAALVSCSCALLDRTERRVSALANDFRFGIFGVHGLRLDRRNFAAMATSRYRHPLNP